MVFLNAQGPIPALGFAFPDVCLTPVVVPVPIPYPNFSMRPTSIPTQFTCYTMMMPNHNLLTMQPMTMGDNGGVNMGVASGMVMGPSRNYTCSIKVFQGVAPVTRMLDVSGHNGMSPNMVGMSISPAQPLVMVLT